MPFLHGRWREMPPSWRNDLFLWDLLQSFTEWFIYFRIKERATASLLQHDCRLFLLWKLQSFFRQHYLWSRKSLDWGSFGAFTKIKLNLALNSALVAPEASICPLYIITNLTFITAVRVLRTRTNCHSHTQQRHSCSQQSVEPLPVGFKSRRTGFEHFWLWWLVEVGYTGLTSATHPHTHFSFFLKYFSSVD